MIKTASCFLALCAVKLLLRLLQLLNSIKVAADRTFSFSRGVSIPVFVSGQDIFAIFLKLESIKFCNLNFQNIEPLMMFALKLYEPFSGDQITQIRS